MVTLRPADTLDYSGPLAVADIGGQRRAGGEPTDAVSPIVPITSCDRAIASATPSTSKGQPARTSP
jgi:hypothetical protein